MKGLYLTGEILDVDGICGGYNLQWAWSSGILAGTYAGRKRPESTGRNEERPAGIPLCSKSTGRNEENDDKN